MTRDVAEKSLVSRDVTQKIRISSHVIIPQQQNGGLPRVFMKVKKSTLLCVFNESAEWRVTACFYESEEGHVTVCF